MNGPNRSSCTGVVLIWCTVLGYSCISMTIIEVHRSSVLVQYSIKHFLKYIYFVLSKSYKFLNDKEIVSKSLSFYHDHKFESGNPGIGPVQIIRLLLCSGDVYGE
jgi:hypothetical protein